MERAADGSVTFWICVGFREYLDLLRGIAEDLAFKVTAFLPALAAFFPVLAAFLPLLRSDTHILSGMAAESYALREFLVKAHPNILAAMVRAGRPRPETSTLAFFVFHQEDAATRRLIEIVAEFGWHLVCPVFDAVVAAPGLESLPGSAAAIRDQFEADTGLRLQCCGA